MVSTVLSMPRARAALIGIFTLALGALGMLGIGCEKEGGSDDAIVAAAPEQPVSSDDDTPGTMHGQVYAVGGVPTATNSPPPYRAVCTIVVLNSGHNYVADFLTDAQGHFETTLAPGSYYLRVKEDSPLAGTVEDGPFEVPAGGSVTAFARYDDGRR